jgi:uncharacterized Zn finger protein (UPF0148 family)
LAISFSRRRLMQTVRLLRRTLCQPESLYVLLLDIVQSSSGWADLGRHAQAAYHRVEKMMFHDHCAMCGRIIELPKDDVHFCASCQEKYQEGVCLSCQSPLLRLRTLPGPWLCVDCETQQYIQQLPLDQRQSIQAIVHNHSRVAAIAEIHNALGISLKDAMSVVNVLVSNSFDASDEHGE